MKRRIVALWLVGGALVAVALPLLVRSDGAATAQAGPKLILFWEENFQGRSLEITGTVADLPVVTDAFGNSFDWNDEVRSMIVVSGTFRLYAHGRLGTQLDNTALQSLDVASKDRIAGWSTLVSATSTGQLELPDGASGGFFHDISSIELVSTQNLPDWAAPVWRRRGR